MSLFISLRFFSYFAVSPVWFVLLMVPLVCDPYIRFVLIDMILRAFAYMCISVRSFRFQDALWLVKHGHNKRGFPWESTLDHSSRPVGATLGSFVIDWVTDWWTCCNRFFYLLLAINRCGQLVIFSNFLQPHMNCPRFFIYLGISALNLLMEGIITIGFDSSVRRLKLIGNIQRPHNYLWFIYTSSPYPVLVLVGMKKWTAWSLPRRHGFGALQTGGCTSQNCHYHSFHATVDWGTQRLFTIRGNPVTWHHLELSLAQNHVVWKNHRLVTGWFRFRASNRYARHSAIAFLVAAPFGLTVE